MNANSVKEPNAMIKVIESISNFIKTLGESGEVDAKAEDTLSKEDKIQLEKMQSINEKTFKSLLTIVTQEVDGEKKSGLVNKDKMKDIKKGQVKKAPTISKAKIEIKEPEDYTK